MMANGKSTEGPAANNLASNSNSSDEVSRCSCAAASTRNPQVLSVWGLANYRRSRRAADQLLMAGG